MQHPLIVEVSWLAMRVDGPQVRICARLASREHGNARRQAIARLLVALALVLLAGCSNTAKPAASSDSTSASTASAPGATDAPPGSTSPGTGAPQAPVAPVFPVTDEPQVVAKPGSPPICVALANSAPVKGVGRALAGLLSEDTRASAEVSLRAASGALRDLSAQVQGDLRGTMTEGAAALDRLGSGEAKDPAVFESAGQVLERLGRDMQAACNFTIS